MASTTSGGSTESSSLDPRQPRPHTRRYPALAIARAPWLANCRPARLRRGPSRRAKTTAYAGQGDRRRAQTTFESATPRAATLAQARGRQRRQRLGRKRRSPDRRTSPLSLRRERKPQRGGPTAVAAVLGRSSGGETCCRVHARPYGLQGRRRRRREDPTPHGRNRRRIEARDERTQGTDRARRSG